MNDLTGWWLDEYDLPRFSKFVNRNGGMAFANDPLANADGECWIWTGTKDPDGYGSFHLAGRMLPAHRVAFMDGARANVIPKGWVVDHLCRNATCVNPEHLEAVPHKVNVSRGKRGRDARPQCVNGHDYDDENTKWVNQNNNRIRTCRQCTRASRQRSNARSVAQILPS